MKTQHAILSWKRHSGECGFRVVTNEGVALFVHDYDKSLKFNISEGINGLHIDVTEFAKDYQFDVPEHEKDPNKLDPHTIDECIISGNEYSVKKLLQSIGWSTEEKQQVYKTPLTEELEREMSSLRFEIGELLRKLNTEK